MAYLRDQEHFESERARWQSLILEDASFPEQVFRQPGDAFIFFEFGLFFTRRFFEGLKNFLISTAETSVCLAVLDPDPVDYFCRSFRKYPVVQITVDDNAQDYLDRLASDPGDSPADAIAYNSTKVVMYPPSLRWAVFGDRDFDWAVFNVSSKGLRNEFVSHLGPENIFTAKKVASFLQEARPRATVEALVKNYPEPM